jgi:hypothetical protein
MANTIVAVRKSTFSVGHNYTAARHTHIVAVKLSTGVALDVPTVIQRIRAGELFYTNAAGVTAKVHPVICNGCRNPYLTTSPDGTKANNLDYLPLF